MKRVLFILCILLNGHAMMLMSQDTRQLFKIQLKKEVFTDDFFLLLKEGAQEDLDVFDATKVSDGFVSIASLRPVQGRLSIDARPFPQQQILVDLSVKGYAAGNYTLLIDPGQARGNGIELSLVDRLLDKKIQIGTEQLNYEFYLDTLFLNGSAMNRFSLVLNRVNHSPALKTVAADLLAFPNPFLEKISLNVRNNEAAEVTIRILDIQGKVCLRHNFKQVMKDQILEIPCGSLLPGIYLLEWKSKAKVKTLKIIKI